MGRFTDPSIRAARLFFSAAAFLLAAAPLLYCQGELVKNGSFMAEGADGLPEGWRFHEWTQGGSDLRIDSDGPGGSKAFTMATVAEDDLKLVQTLKVEPATVYRISCKVKAKIERSDRKGANLSGMSIVDTSASAYDTGGRWEELVLYGKTGKKQKEFELTLRLGGFSSVNSGMASFAEVSAVKADALPSGQTIVNLQAPPAAPASPVKSSDALILVAMGLGALGLWYLMDKSRVAKAIDGGRGGRGLILGLLGAALAMRLPFCFGGYGHPTDLGTFIAWADQAAASKLVFFYKDAAFADYPPGYIYILALLGAIKNLFGLGSGSPGTQFLIRVPALAADLALGYFIYRRLATRSGRSRALLAAAFFLLNPVSVQNSAIWGQVDSVFALLVFLSVDSLALKRAASAGIFYALAALVKPQAFLFAPVFLCAFASWRKPKEILACLGAGVGVLLAGFAPFMPVQGPLFPLDLYLRTLGSYAYGSVNAANLWALLGKNYAPLSGLLLGIPMSAWGTGVIVALTLASFALYYFIARKKKAGEERPYFEVAAFLILGAFALCTKMHERYLYPFVPLALGALAGRKSLRLAWAVLAASAAHYLNVSLIYRLHGTGTWGVQAADPQFLFSAALACICLPLFVYLSRNEASFDRDKEKPLPLPPWLADKAGYSLLDERPEKAESRRNLLWLGGLTALSLALGFIYLADFRVPSTAWTAARGEAAIIDLGAERDIASFSIYSGIGDGEFSLSGSTDGVSYSGGQAFTPSLYAWKNQAFAGRYRYLKVSVNAPGARLLEIAFWGAGSMVPYPAAADISGKALVDEQKRARPFATALDSMYFDEIYHGRTAYEHLHAMEPYEWTHPPLGKLIIAVGIRIFGMDPFGWRIMGVIFGAFLVPLLYAVARGAFPRGPWALGAAAAYAADFMRYTQTRIGTVDVYVVFFVLASYAAMYRFYISALDEKRKRPDLGSLALSGLAFSLGAATKWNAVYAGFGLATIFFIAFVPYARRTISTGKGGALKRGAVPLGVLGLCVSSFILLPLLVYAASYIPTLYVPGYGWGNVWRWQRQMLDYHSQLKATHAFASPWWQWPWIVKPVWYFKADGLSAGMASTIVAMGNPLIFWPSLLALVAATILAFARRDKRMIPILAGFISQYLPWMLVPRLTFLYHYFPIVPFGLLSLINLFKPIAVRGGADALALKAGTSLAARAWVIGRKNILLIYVIACAALFVLFFPAISGLPVPAGWIRALRWSPSWFF